VLIFTACGGLQPSADEIPDNGSGDIDRSELNGLARPQAESRPPLSATASKRAYELLDRLLVRREARADVFL